MLVLYRGATMGVESPPFYRLMVRRVAARSSRERAKLLLLRILPNRRFLSYLGELPVAVRIFNAVWICLAVSVGLQPVTHAASYDGVLTINVADEETGDPLAVRMELRKKGRPVRVRPEGAISQD